MNKAANQRLLKAMDANNVEGVRRALMDGADPAYAAEKGDRIPAFYLTQMRERQDQARAMFALMLEHGLSPNVVVKQSDGWVGLGKPLVIALCESERENASLKTLTLSDQLVIDALNAGSDPRAEYKSKYNYNDLDFLGSAQAPTNLWYVASRQGRWHVLQRLRQIMAHVPEPSEHREHPITAIFHQRLAYHQFDWPDIAEWWHQHHPRWFDHRYRGGSPLMWIAASRDPEPIYQAVVAAGVVWALNHGAAWSDAWQSKDAPPRPFTVWPLAVQTAVCHGVDNPVFQAMVQHPEAMPSINLEVSSEPEDKVAAESGRRSLDSPLGWAAGLHVKTDQVSSWLDALRWLRDRGAVLPPESPTLGQRWAANGAQMVDQEYRAAVEKWLKDHPEDEAPHPQSGRTPLFEVEYPALASWWEQRGHRLDHVDAAGDQAFTHLVRKAVESASSTALVAWCANAMMEGRAPLEGTAGGRSLEAWCMARKTLSEALKKARKARAIKTVLSSDALFVALEAQRWGEAQKLIVRHPEWLHSVDDKGRSPLMVAACQTTTNGQQTTRQHDWLIEALRQGADLTSVNTVTFDLDPSNVTSWERKKNPSQMGEPCIMTGAFGQVWAQARVWGKDASSLGTRKALIERWLKTPNAFAHWDRIQSMYVAKTLIQMVAAKQWARTQKDPNDVEGKAWVQDWSAGDWPAIVKNDVLGAICTGPEDQEQGWWALGDEVAKVSFDASEISAQVERLLNLGASWGGQTCTHKTPFESLKDLEADPMGKARIWQGTWIEAARVEYERLRLKDAWHHEHARDVGEIAAKVPKARL